MRKSFGQLSGVIIGLLLLVGGGGCGIYSLSGGSVPTGVETISIEQFENNASIIVPTLSLNLTEALKDRFINQTNLRLVNYDGDMRFTGAITNYAIAPIAIQGNEVAAQNRLTIGVKVTLEVPDHEEMEWSQGFTQFADFPATTSLSSIESSLVTEILEKMTLDIFNKSLSNW